MYKIAQTTSLVTFLFWTFCSFSQSFVEPDSLKNRSYEEVYELFLSDYKDTLKSQLLLKSCLKKAKVDLDSLKMAQALVLLSYYEKNDSLKLNLLNTSIVLSHDKNHKDYPAYMYSSRGGFYLSKWNYEQALDDYLMALTYARKNNDEDFQYITQHNIGIIKSKLGKHEEALNIFRKCLQYENKKGVQNSLDYLDLMVDLTESYTKNGMIDSSNYYLDRVIPVSKRLDRDLNSKFIYNRGVNFYYNKEYIEAKETFEKSLTKLVLLEDKRELVNSYYYLGKINELNSDREKTIYYYKKIDSVFKKREFITPEVRDGYLFLIDDYKAKQDYENQLFYVDRLLRFDSILHKNNTRVNEQLIMQYDTPQLLAEKEQLISVINKKNSNFKAYIWGLVLVVLITCSLFYYQYRKRKLYKERFNTLMKSHSGQKTNRIEHRNKTAEIVEKRNLKIAQEIKEDILYKLERFEKNLEFLEPNITTSSLAIRFKTNSKYISRIVNTYKDKNFTNYINDLRIEYLIEELKTNKKFRNYTIKAISSEIGFNTTEAFSKYFHKKTGIYPSYFIKKMETYTEVA